MLTKNDMDHLQFIYDRLRDIHGETPRVDYMMRLGQIIDGAALQTPPREIPAYQPPPDPMIANRRYDNMKIKLECRPIEVKERKLKLDEDGFMRIMWGGQVVKVKPEDFFRNDQDIEVAHGEDVEDMLKKALESEVEKELTAEDAKVKAILIPKLTDEELLNELSRRNLDCAVTGQLLRRTMTVWELMVELCSRVVDGGDGDFRDKWTRELCEALDKNGLYVKSPTKKEFILLSTHAEARVGVAKSVIRTIYEKCKDYQKQGIRDFGVDVMLKEIRYRLDGDSDWRRSWVDNIACLLMDNSLWKVVVPKQGRVDPIVLAHDKRTRDEIAEKIVNLVFGQKGDVK